MILILDIDGTLTDFEARARVCGPVPSHQDKVAFEAWLSQIMRAEDLQLDRKVPGISQIVSSLQSAATKTIYLTNRREQFRQLTEDWLFENEFVPHTLIMRANADWSPSEVYKGKVIEDLKRFYSGETVVVLDDDHDGRASAFYRRLGCVHLKVMWCLYNEKGERNESYGKV